MVTTANDGGPAFPSVTKESVFVEELGRYDDRLGPPMGGMSLRDYFAAHAPDVPAPWFEPTMPPKPSEPPIATDLNEESRRTLRSWVSDPIFDLDHAANELRDANKISETGHTALVTYERDYTAYRRACDAWEQVHAKQTDVQWPYAWADLQLAERERA